MNSRALDEQTKRIIAASQKNEITEHIIYEKLAQSTKDSQKKGILQRISDEELTQHNFWKKHASTDMRPGKLKIWTYFLSSQIVRA
jgi:hypothetical protein